MSRLPRNALPSQGRFHLTARGVDRCLTYRDVHDYRSFLAHFLRLVREAGLTVYVYCLMPNHYHVVAEGPMEAISRLMHRLNGKHARRFNDRHGRTGHLFQARFDSRFIASDGHLANACAYVLNNPVRAGLCLQAEDWPWSGWLYP